MTKEPIVLVENVRRKNRWTAQVVLNMPSNVVFDWSTMQFRCVMKADRRRESPVLYTVTPSVSISGNVATVILDIPGVVSDSPSIPARVAVDLSFYRTSPVVGPYTPVQFDINFLPAA